MLWELGRASVREVHESFPPEREIDFATVQTYLRRLEKKGYVQSTSEGRTKFYRAKVKPRTVIRETIDDLVERLFAGDTVPLVRHLIEDRKIGESDIAELRRLLDRLEDEQ